MEQVGGGKKLWVHSMAGREMMEESISVRYICVASLSRLHDQHCSPVSSGLQTVKKGAFKIIEFNSYRFRSAESKTTSETLRTWPPTPTNPLSPSHTLDVPFPQLSLYPFGIRCTCATSTDRFILYKVEILTRPYVLDQCQLCPLMLTSFTAPFSCFGSINRPAYHHLLNAK